MAKPAMRVGDSTKGMCEVGSECCPHSRSGSASNGSQDVFINGRPAMRVGDSGYAGCPHGGQFMISSGSTSVFINGRPAARMSDQTVCKRCGMPGQVINGSQDVFIGE